MTMPNATVVEVEWETCTARTDGAAVPGAVPTEWVAVPDAARIAGAGLRTVRRWIAQGEVNSRLVEVNGHPVRQVEVASLLARGLATGSANGQSARVPPAAGSAAGSAITECQCCKVWERQCGTLEEQLALRAEEINLRSHAEQELRVLIGRLERTNAELAGALVQRALPPAVEVTPRRVRWWSWWKR